MGMDVIILFGTQTQVDTDLAAQVIFGLETVRIFMA